MDPLAYTKKETLTKGNYNFIKHSPYLNVLAHYNLTDGQLVEKLVKFYDGCQINDLVTLWLDNLNSIMALDLTKEKHNTSTFIIINKLMAIATIVKEKY